MAFLEAENAAQALRIAGLEAENVLQAARIVELEAMIKVLLDKVTMLEKLVRGDSSNSSRPPSSDSGTAKNKRPIANTRKLNKQAKRSQGKQPGAPGATLNTVTDPDEIIVHGPVRCGGCGNDLDDTAPVVGVSARQVFDIPTPNVHVTEHGSNSGAVDAGV